MGVEIGKCIQYILPQPHTGLQAFGAKETKVKGRVNGNGREKEAEGIYGALAVESTARSENKGQKPP
ncbi:MAG: hypothetical protein E7333_08960 [Clostridiales bacterium]|nr:hypothetical protein [Clostridiales bacterium]